MTDKSTKGTPITERTEWKGRLALWSLGAILLLFIVVVGVGGGASTAPITGHAWTGPEDLDSCFEDACVAAWHECQYDASTGREQNICDTDKRSCYRRCCNMHRDGSDLHYMSCRSRGDGGVL